MRSSFSKVREEKALAASLPANRTSRGSLELWETQPLPGSSSAKRSQMQQGHGGGRGLSGGICILLMLLVTALGSFHL